MDAPVVIVDGRAIERIAHYLTPVLPTGIGAVVVVVIVAGDMVGDIHGMVVIERAALILGIEILYHHIMEPAAVLEIEFGTEHDVLEVIHIETAVLLHHILVALAIAVVVEHEHTRMVFKEVVGVKPQPPGIGVVVDTHEPAAQLVALYIGIFTLAHVATTRDKGIPERAQPGIAFFGLYRTIFLRHIGSTTKLGTHLESQFQ